MDVAHHSLSNSKFDGDLLRGLVMRIATWNVNSMKARLHHVLEYCKAGHTDIILAQELKLTDENFPVDAFREIGWQVATHGQKTYNGVAILSPHEISDVICGLDGEPEDDMHDMHDESDVENLLCSWPDDTGDEQHKGNMCSSSQSRENHCRENDVGQVSMCKDIKPESGNPENINIFQALDGKIDRNVKNAMKRKNNQKCHLFHCFTVLSCDKLSRVIVNSRTLRLRGGI